MGRNESFGEGRRVMGSRGGMGKKGDLRDGEEWGGDDAAEGEIR